jgi:hypothetical protein
LREDLPTSLLYFRKAVAGAICLHGLLRNYLQLKELLTRKVRKPIEFPSVWLIF